MKSIKKSFLYGIIVWIVPFVISFGFYLPSGELSIDKIFFKTIMIIAGTLIGTFLIVEYFKSVENSFLKEGILLGTTWLLINWILDFMILISIADMSYISYFKEIGLRYLTFPIFSIATAYLLKQKHIEK